ncbi:MAG: hypothetical protein ACRD9S_01080 [Pyrinomonadaceae bacterium]
MEPPIKVTPNLVRPKAVTRAIRVISASFVIGGIRSVFDLKQKLSGGSFLAAILLLIVFLGICFFFVSKIAAGRNWARFTLLVLLLIQLPFAVLGSIAELKMNLLHGSLSVIIALLQLIGTYLLFTKNANPWFRSRK